MRSNTRRTWLLATAALLNACAAKAPADTPPPIVFVHGNGDSAALWLTTAGRFESNGWPRERLHAIKLPYPLARDADDKPQPGRSSTTKHMQFLATGVEHVLAPIINLASMAGLSGSSRMQSIAYGTRKGAALLFASAAGQHITGQILVVDGGVSAVHGE
jgi:triacylglycerol esterase/lipase EstA (alpha/beta hydrolase family)